MQKKHLATILFLIFLSLVAPRCFAEQTIYLVRHAEKVSSSSKDPSLTEQGRSRAKVLAQILRSANIKHIYSTAYKRTQQTAKPLSELLELAISSYDPRDLTQFAEQLQALDGNVLVVGHSNTTPQMVDALGGTSAEAISETEYDHLYQVILLKDEVITNLLRSYLPSAAPNAPIHQSKN